SGGGRGSSACGRHNRTRTRGCSSATATGSLRYTRGTGESLGSGHAQWRIHARSTGGPQNLGGGSPGNSQVVGPGSGLQATLSRGAAEDSVRDGQDCVVHGEPLGRAHSTLGLGAGRCCGSNQTTVGQGSGTSRPGLQGGCGRAGC